MARTIPEPTQTDFNLAFNAIRNQAEIHGIDVLSIETTTFLVHQAEVKAQLQAEIRFLRNMLHPQTMIEDSQ